MAEKIKFPYFYIYAWPKNWNIYRIDAHWYEESAQKKDRPLSLLAAFPPDRQTEISSYRVASLLKKDNNITTNIIDGQTNNVWYRIDAQLLWKRKGEKKRDE